MQVIIIVTTKQPRKDWGNKNVKRLELNKDFEFIDITPERFFVDNNLSDKNPLDLEIPASEIASITITY